MEPSKIDKKPVNNTEEFTKEELLNIKVCCIKAAKSSETTDAEMKYLLALSDKITQIINKIS